MTEANKQWQLNLYELHRKPLQIPTRSDKENMVTMKTAVLTDLLTCPICLDVLENTMVTKNCLHRFCSVCITTALRQSNQECPTCRKKLVSRRCLRPDPNFDSLICKLFPGRKEQVEKEKADMMNLVKQHSTKLQQTAAARGILAENSSDTENAPAKSSKGRGRKRKSTPAEKPDDNQVESETGMIEQEENIKNPKSSSKSSKKKKKQNDHNNNSDEEIQPTPPEPKKRKRKTKKLSSVQNSAHNSAKNSENDNSDAESTVSKLSKISKNNQDSKPSTPKTSASRKSKKNSTPTKNIIFSSSPEESADEADFSESSINSEIYKSTDFHFILKKINEDDDVVATEFIGTCYKTTVEHIREFIFKKLVSINIRKNTVLIGPLDNAGAIQNLEDSLDLDKIYDTEFDTSGACSLYYKVIKKQD